jgi:hypothetical protein
MLDPGTLPRDESLVWVQFRQVQMNSYMDHLAQMQVQSDGGKQRF